jgi:hypothetical protein
MADRNSWRKEMSKVRQACCVNCQSGDITVCVCVWTADMLHVLIILIPLKTQLVPRSKHSISVLTRQAVQGNTDARSCNHCCSGKAMSIVQPVCVFVALGIQHEYCHLWSARIYNIFPHKFINGMIFGGGGVIEHKMCVSSFFTTFIWNTFHSKNKWTRYDHICILVFI